MLFELPKHKKKNLRCAQIALSKNKSVKLFLFGKDYITNQVKASYKDGLLFCNLKASNSLVYWQAISFQTFINNAEFLIINH